MASLSAVTGGQVQARVGPQRLGQREWYGTRCVHPRSQHLTKVQREVTCGNVRGKSVRNLTETQHSPNIQHAGASASRAFSVRCSAVADASTPDTCPPKPTFGGETDNDTIIAIATPVVPQAGGIAIIRLSGDQAVPIVQKLFRAKGQDGGNVDWK
eukprot:5790350-Pyramimonas_sp.AAC.1